MHVLRHALVLGFTAILGGCVLLIDEIETQDHCGIQGTGLCADCIRSSCQELVDKCCAQNECTGSAILSELDNCGRNHNAECADALAVARVPADQEAIRACVETSCKTPCTSGSTGTGNPNRPAWNCDTARKSSTECGTCIYESCATSVDDCCGDSSCKNDDTIQKDMAACVAGDEHGCAYLREDSRSTSGKAGVVRRCIQEKCVKQCLGDGLPHTKCTLQSGGDYCTCTNAEQGGTQECTKALVGGDCFVGKQGCTCGTYSCDPYITDSCKCSLGKGTGAMGQSCRSTSTTSSSSGSGTPSLCCLKLDGASISCECLSYTSECKAERDEYNTASCDRADVLDALVNSGLVVDACSR